MEVLDAPFAKGFIRLTEDAYKKGWHERNGGNLTYRIKEAELAEIRENFRQDENWAAIGVTVPNLAGEFFLVTGSGKFFRNVVLDPEENIAVIEIDNSGERYRICWGMCKGGRPTSELPTHLECHSIKKGLTGGAHRVVLHSHTTNIIALTFVLPLEDAVFTRELWEMATECPVVFPEGVGVIPWGVPGGGEIALATAAKMRDYNIAIWAHHGTFCSGEDFDLVFGLMDTAEKSAEILVKVLSMGGKKQTIMPNDFRALAAAFDVQLKEIF